MKKEKFREKTKYLILIFGQTVDNHPLFGGGCLFSV